MGASEGGAISERGRLLGIVALQREIVGAERDVQATLAMVTGRAMSVTLAAGAAVLMVEGDAAVCRAASGSLQRELGMSIPIAGSLAGRAVLTGESLWSEDTEVDARVNRELARRTNTRSLGVVPLGAASNYVGVLTVVAPWPGAFTETDLDALQIIGGLVSGVLRGAWAVSEADHRFRSLAEYASDAVISLNPAGAVEFWNHTAVRVFGHEVGEAMGIELAAILRQPDGSGGCSLEQLAALVASSQARPVELRGRRKGGSEFPVEVSVAKRTHAGEPVFTLIVRDVTERKLIEEQLSHATRLISIGTLASGIGHEINNPLSYVMYNLEFASETIDAILGGAQDGSLDLDALQQKLAPLRDDLIEAYNGADRIRAILRDLRTFSRAGDERKLATSVSRAADAAINMVFNQIRHHARVVKDYQDTAPVDAVEGKLVQVIVNLLVNAAQATVQGRPEENVIRVRSATNREGWVELEVSDTGVGIPASDLSRIFDPFYTTKGVGSGTGLGLSISHGIVRSFGGTIEVESEVGRGSTFRVKLPASQPTDGRASQRPRNSGIATPRRARVMVIDDEPQVSASLQRMMAREHDVVAYTSSRAAARELLAGARYDLILCDLMMPELPGWELFSQLTDDQKARVAFMTGGAFQPSARKFLAGIKNPVLDKPIDGRLLRTLLRDRLGA